MTETKQMDVAIRELQESAIAKVKNDTDRDGAIAFLRAVKARRDEVIEHYREMKQNAHVAWKTIVAKEKGYLDQIAAVERQINAAVLEYNRKVAAARERQRAIQQAAADEAARKERERLEKQSTRVKGEERKAALLEQAALVVAPEVQIAETPKADGVTTRKTWKARVVDVALVPREYLVPNQTALDGFARATKGAVPLAGVEFYQVETLAVHK